MAREYYGESAKYGMAASFSDQRKRRHVKLEESPVANTISDAKASKFAARRRFLRDAKIPFTELEMYQCERALAEWADQKLAMWSAAARAISGCHVHGPSFTATALQLVNEERTKQLQRGYDRDHDAAHRTGAIALAAAAMAMRSASESGVDAKASIVWPWPEQMPKRESALRDAVIAAALAVAEVERLLSDGMYGDAESGLVIVEVYPETWIAGKTVEQCVEFAEREFGKNGVAGKADGYPKVMDKASCHEHPYHDEDGRMIGSFASVLAAMATDGKTVFPCYFAGSI